MITCQFEDGGKGNLRHVVNDVIVLNKNRDQILLVKRGQQFTNPGKLALPGGYLNRNETIADSAVREVREETGFDAKIIDLFIVVDNPNRKSDERQNVGFVYLAEALRKIGEHDHEIENAKWYSLDNLPNSDQFAFDHKEFIDQYLKYLKEPFDLPYIKSN